jgi:hypothetical protein
MRWSEEVLLLREETRRVLVFLQWNADWWEEQRQDQGSETDHEEGVIAYARKQAQIRRSIRVSFENMWCGLDEYTTLGIGADHEILDFGPAATSRLSDLFQSVVPASLGSL